MHAWILEDIFGRRWRLSLEAPLAGAALSQTRAVNAIERLASFVYDSALRVDRRNAVAFGEIGERLGSGLDGWPTGFEAEDILLGNEGMDAQLCFGRTLTRLLEDAVIVGRLHVQESPEARGMFDPPAPRPDRPAPVAPKPSEPTWFEVRVVDTFGRPVSGVGLVLARGARRETTNAAGVARWAGVEAEVSLSAVKVADLAALRERLLPEWGRGATSAGLRPEGTRASLFADEVSAQVRCEEPLTLILENPVRRVRLVGMHFDTNKCFLLPSAMPGIRRVRHLYERAKTTQYLVVGHTDTKGDPRYNETLSLERARAIVAYLRDDAATWMAWFSTRHDEKCWGSREIAAMLSALPEGSAPFVRQGDTATAAAICAFQRWSNETRGSTLVVDGVAGDLTKRALVEAYMALDHTSLPPEAQVTAHGCGPHRPPVAPEDGAATSGDTIAEEARRVDVFAFQGAPMPPPRGPISKAAAPEYAEWVKQVSETHDVRAAELGMLRIWLMDERRQRMPGARYRLRVGACVREGVATPEGLVEEHGLDLDATASLGWGALPTDDPRRGLLDHLYERDVHTLLTPEPPRDEHVLHNLGYTTDSVENRLIVFEADYEAPRGKIHDVHREGTCAPEGTEREE